LTFETQRGFDNNAMHHVMNGLGDVILRNWWDDGFVSSNTNWSAKHGTILFVFVIRKLSK